MTYAFSRSVVNNILYLMTAACYCCLLFKIFFSILACIEFFYKISLLMLILQVIMAHMH